MMRALVVVLALLAGCATEPRQNVVSGVRIEEVKVPLLIPCVYVDEVPKVPGTWMSDTQTKEKRRLAVLADLKETEDYIIRADGLLRGCAKPREATR